MRADGRASASVASEQPCPKVLPSRSDGFCPLSQRVILCHGEWSLRRQKEWYRKIFIEIKILSLCYETGFFCFFGGKIYEQKDFY